MTPIEYVHDEVGYNYRLTNIQAALGCAQMEQLDEFLYRKRTIAGDVSTKHCIKSAGTLDS